MIEYELSLSGELDLPLSPAAFQWEELWQIDQGRSK